MEQIIKQRYIADYFNGYSAWCLERRTRVLKFPPFFCNSTTEGSNGTYDFIPERYVYPLSEITNNTAAYWSRFRPIDTKSVSDKQHTQRRQPSNSFENVFGNPLLENADANYMNRTIAYSSRHLQNGTAIQKKNLSKTSKKYIRM